MVKKIFVIKLMLVFLLSLNSIANSVTPEEGARALGEMYDQYATVAGGWYMNKRCLALNGDETAEFEWHVAQSNIAMGRITKNQPMLLTIQKSAKKASESEEYADCGEKSEEIIRSSFEMAKNLNMVLTKKPYIKGKSDDNYLLKRYSFIFTAMKLNDKCNYLSDSIKEDVLRVYSQIADKIAAKVPNKFKIINESLNKNIKLERAGCNEKSYKAVTQALVEIKALEKQLL